MNFGTVAIQNGAVFAPMAGFSDTCGRAIAAEFGAAATVTEMVSAKALTYGDRKTALLMQNRTEGTPWGVQLFGSEPQVMERAAQIVTEKTDCDFLDINMGCPVPKIVGSGAGSGLMRTPELAGEVVRAVCKGAGGRPVTVKMRIGWDPDALNAPQLALICQQAGAAAVTVHGRTRSEMYNPGIHPEVIAMVKQAVSIPVVANGDIHTAEDALALLQQTGADGVMVGRAALGNPWLFGQIKAALNGETVPVLPTPAKRMAVMRRHIQMMCDEEGEWVAMPKARSQALHYMLGLRGAASLRRMCCELKYFTDVDALIDRALQMNEA